MEAIKPQSKTEYNELLMQKNITVVKFTATWCGPCKVLKPKLDDLVKQYKTDNVQFLEVDVDECLELAEQEHIEAMPTVVIYQKGQRVETIVGVNFDRIKAMIDKYASAT